MKKFLILFPGMILLLSINGCGCEPETSQPGMADEDAAELTEEEIQAEIEVCNKQKSYFQNQCFQNLAVKAKDPDLCDKVEDIESTGYETGAELFIHKGVCISYVAMELDYDISLCDRVKDNQEYFDLCVGYTTQEKAQEFKDPEVCEDVDLIANWYANCLAYSVKDESEIGVCDRISDRLDHELCVNSSYMELSQYKDDVDFCYQIGSSNYQEFCVGSYAKFKEDANICHDLKTDQGLCVCYNLYFEELNEEICAGLEDVGQKANCEKCLEMDLFGAL